MGTGESNLGFNRDKNVDVVYKFSNLVFHNEYENAMQELLVILATVPNQSFSVHEQAIKEKEALRITRNTMSVLASGITALVSDPGFGLTEGGFRSLIALKFSLRKIFASTSFDNMSHILKLLGKLEGDQVTISQQEIPKVFLICGLDSIDDTSMLRIERMIENTQLMIWVSLLDVDYLLLEREQINLNRLLEMTGKIRPTPFMSPLEIISAARVWFACSFWDSPKMF